MVKKGRSQTKGLHSTTLQTKGLHSITADITRYRGGREDEAAAKGHRWTFLTNHAHVLILLHRKPGIVLREVAIEVGITERAVQRIIQDLEEEGFIRREKVGRKNQYEVLINQPLRHPIESHKTIGELLNLVAR